MYHSTLGLRVIKKKTSLEEKTFQIMLTVRVPMMVHSPSIDSMSLTVHWFGVCGSVGLIFKAHRLVYQSTLGCSVIKKKKKRVQGFWECSTNPGHPHGGLRPVHQKSTCFTQLTSGPYAVWFGVCGSVFFRGINESWPPTRWATTLSSKGNLLHAINLRALCGANLVTQPSK